MEDVEVKERATRGKKKVEMADEETITAMNLDSPENKDIYNPLRKEIVMVKFLPKQGKITDKNHVLYGGMAEGAVRAYTVPILVSTGLYVNVLTDNEKKFFEETLGLESNALSIYKKKDNFWDNYFVRVPKTGLRLDLSVPEDYIKYKVLLANKDYICPSQEEFNRSPKATYQFILTTNDTDVAYAKSKLQLKKECYKLFGKFENDSDMMRVIIEIIDGRPLDKHTKKDWMQVKIDELIDSDVVKIHKVMSDPALPAYTLIKRAVDAGLIAKRGNYYYLRSDNSPLCEENQEPTLIYAAKYISLPKNQDIKFALEAKLNSEE